MVPIAQSLTPPVSEAGVIEVVSDVICPWCYIGKRRIEAALRLVERSDIRLHWKPFELNPGAPPEGYIRAEYRARKFGSAAYAGHLEKQVAEAAAQEGLGFRFDRIQRVPNTFDAHRLIWLAGEAGSQDAVVEGLFQAYFVDGEDVGSAAVLERIGAARGLNIDAFREGAGTVQVRAELEQSLRAGVTAVPTFFVGGRPLMSGAQKPELLASVLATVFGGRQCSAGDGTCG